MKLISLNQLPLHTDDFFLTDFDIPNKKDAIVVHNPSDAVITSPVFLRSKKTLEDHVAFIRDNNIKKAYIVADDIHFLKNCPSIEYLKVYPSITAQNFDYTPIYEMPNLKWVVCLTTTGLDDHVVSSIDYGRMKPIYKLGILDPKGHINVNQARGVKSLYFDCGFPDSCDLRNVIPGKELLELSICQAPIRSLDGIEDQHFLRRLELSYNRKLTDISALYNLRKSLVNLEIDTCGKIRDFSVLSELDHLEYLSLRGSNSLDDLSFLKKMPKLKCLLLTMNVADGNLGLCKNVPYVKIKNRAHYSLKDKDLPKNISFCDVEPINIFE